MFYDEVNSDDYISLTENNTIRVINGKMYDHKVNLSLNIDVLSQNKVRYFNTENSSEFIDVTNVEVIGEDNFRLEVDAFNGTSLIYDVVVLNPNNNEYQTNNKIWRWIAEKVVEGVIEHVIDETLEDSDGGKAASCTDQAIEACGQGNVATVDFDSGWFSSSCSYTCK